MKINSILPINNNFKFSNIKRQHFIQPKLQVDSVVFGANTQKVPVYSLSLDGKIQKFESVLSAQRTFKSKGENITRTLRGDSMTNKGFTFLRAKDVEDEKGNINFRVLDSALKSINCFSVYVVHQDGKIQKFNSITQAQKELNVSANVINDSINGHFPTFSQLKYVFLKANDVEIYQTQNQENPIVLDDKKIYEARKKILESQIQQDVFVVSQNGEVVKYPSRREASKAINSAYSKIEASVLYGRKIISNGVKYRCVRGSLIETLNEDLSIGIDEQKINKILKSFES